MPTWLIPIGDWLIHSGARFISVLFIALVLIGGPFYLWNHGKSVGANIGYKLGYNQALKDHPQNIYNGQSTVIQQQPAALYGIKLGSHWGFGIIHER